MCDCVTDITPPMTWAEADEPAASNIPTASVKWNRRMEASPVQELTVDSLLVWYFCSPLLAPTMVANFSVTAFT